MAATITQNSKPLRPRALDTSGNNNHGTAYTGQALEFDGVADYITMPLTLMNGATAISISLWFKTTGANGGMIAKYANSSMYAWWITVKGSKLCANINANQSAQSDLLSAGDVNDGQWHQAVLTWSYSSGLASLYLDGVLIDTDANTNESDLRTGTLTNPIGFQGYINSATPTTQAAGWYAGLLSNVQIWDTVLTASDVAYAYLNPEKLALDTPSTSLTYSNLKLWYPMQDVYRGQQSFLIDGANTGLGSDLVVNGDFSDNSVTTTSGGSSLTGWTNHSTHNGSNYASISSGQLTIVSDGTNTGIYQNVLTIGKLYKLEYTVVVNNGGSIATIFAPSEELTSTVGTHTKYFIAGNAGLGFKRHGGFACNITLDNISVKAVNAKNHGTSVFYGDEILSNTGFETLKSGESGNTVGTVTDLFDNWTVALGGSSTVEADTDVSPQAGTYACKMTYDGGQSYVYQDATVVSGRNYTLTFYVRGDGSKSGHIRVHKTTGGDYIAEADIGQTAASWAQKTYTFTADANGDVRIRLLTDTAASSVWFDEVSFKETGFATGWTDADAQPTIPQLGFQSYNQLAWFSGLPNDTLVDINADTTLASGTYSFWAISDMSTANGKNTVFGHGNYQHGCFSMNWSSNMPILRTGSNQYVFWDDNAAQDDGKWHHWVVYLDHSTITDSKLYIDGVLQSQNTTAATGSHIAWAEGLNIGAEKADPLYPFIGCITEFSWWNKELSLAEAQELYNDGEALDATLHSSAANLSGYWRNEGGDTWADLSTNSNNGTAASVSEYLTLPKGSNGRDTQGFLMNRNRVGLNLSGVGNYIKVPINHTFGTNDFSYGFWFKIQDGQGMYMTGVQTIGHAGGVGLTMDAGNGKIRSRPFGATAVYTSAAYDDNEWHYAHHNIDRSANAILYIDGDTAVLTQDISSDSGDSLSTDSWHIGAENGTGNYFDGMIDDFNVYSSLLTTAQIARNYKAGKRRHRS